MRVALINRFSRVDPETQKILDRIQKLVALSASSQIEEARTSAYMACALIRKHSLYIGPEEPAWPNHANQSIDEQADGRLIIIKHATFCKKCKQPVLTGTLAWWVKGAGVWHQHCRP